LKQLNDREQNYENIEVKIVLLKREIEKEKKQSKFENNSKILNDNLKNKRSPNDKTRILGYDQNSTSTAQKNDKQSTGYADALRSSLKIEDNMITMAPLNTGFNKQAPSLEGKGNTMIRRNHPNRYQHIFLGY
jgi:hypothetical protein